MVKIVPKGSEEGGTDYLWGAGFIGTGIDSCAITLWILLTRF